MVPNGKKLTNRQVGALAKLAVRPGSPYQMRVGLGTLESLLRHNLAVPVGPSHMANPHNGIWQITETGRAALEASA